MLAILRRAHFAPLLLILALMSTSFACDNPPCEPNEKKKPPPEPLPCGALEKEWQKRECFINYCADKEHSKSPFCIYFLEKLKNEKAESKKRKLHTGSVYDGPSMRRAFEPLIKAKGKFGTSGDGDPTVDSDSRDASKLDPGSAPDPQKQAPNDPTKAAAQ